MTQTAMNPRFDKFVETQIFTYYGCNVFKEIDYSNMEIKNDFETLLREFKIDLGINYEIDNDSVVINYMEDNECIGKDNVKDYILFVKIILEKIYDILNNFKTFKKKNDVVLSKKEIKDRENEAKNIVKEQKEQLKKEEKTQTKLLKEQERAQHIALKEEYKLQKEKERLDTKAYNLTIIECDCGISIARMNLRNHQFGKDHIIRMDALRWFINKHTLDIKIE